MKQIIVVLGQTATGKTKYAVELSKKNNGVLINCDSRQIYKKLNIITGKDIGTNTFHCDSKLDYYDLGYYLFENSIPIWLYDIVDPRSHFSSYEYTRCAHKVIEQIYAMEKTPILVGGTYLYIKHLLGDLEIDSVEPNWELRTELGNKNINELQNILKEIAPAIYNSLNASDVHNPRRLIRKIEIQYAQQKESTTATKKRTDNMNFNEIIMYGFQFKHKENLIKKITERVEERLQLGAIKEVENLINTGYSEKDPGLNTIGYHQLLDYLHHKISLDKAVQTWIIKEIQYAKRQITFMKKDSRINWRFVG